MSLSMKGFFRATVIISLSLTCVYIYSSQYASSLAGPSKFRPKRRPGYEVKNGGLWVITRQFAPCQDVALREVNVLVVSGDDIFYSDNIRCKLNSVSIKFSSRTATRKTGERRKTMLLAYLVALKNGAQVIYVGHTRNGRLLKVQEFHKSFRKTFLMTNKQTRCSAVYDPSEHFWCKLSPTARCLRSGGAAYEMCNITNPSATFAFVDSDRSRILNDHVITNTESSSPLLLSNHVTFYNQSMSNTMLSKDFLWLGFVIVDSESNWDRALSWSYFMQILYKRLQSYIIFAPGCVTGDINIRFPKFKRNTWNKHSNFFESLFCSQVKCDGLSRAKCATQLLGEFVRQKIFDIETKQSFLDWLHDWKELELTKSSSRSRISEMTCDSATPYMFFPSEMADLEESRQPAPMYLHQEQSNKLIASTCPDAKYPAYTQQSIKSWRDKHRSLLLLVWFNDAAYYRSSVAFTEAVYRPVFPNILYCGPKLPSSKFFEEFDVSFVTRYRDGTVFNMHDGQMNYGCLQRALDMNYREFKGYLVMGDDVMLNFWNMEKFSRNKMWTEQCGYNPTTVGWVADIRTGKECNQVDCSKVKFTRSPHFRSHDGSMCLNCSASSTWMWWNVFKKEVLRVLTHSNVLMRKCADKNTFHHGADHVINGRMGTDLFYIPERFIDKYHILSKLFLDHGVYMEIAIPMIVNCLADNFDDDIEILSGDGYWDAYRNQPWVHFPKNIDDVFFHPSKLSLVSKEKVFRDYFCNMVMSNVTAKVRKF